MRNAIRKIYIIMVIVFGIIASVLFIQFNFFNQILTGETQKLTASERDRIGREISGELRRQGQILTDIADYIALEKWKSEELFDYMKRLSSNNAYFSALYFGTTDNEIINGSGWISQQSFDPGTSPWYFEAIKENKLIFTEVLLPVSQDKLIVTIAKPVYNSSNQLLGVVAGDVSIKDIVSISMVKNKEITGQGYSFLLDGNGIILAHSNNEYESTSKLKIVNQISNELTTYLAQNEPGITKISLEGIDGYLAYQSIADTNLKIATFIPVNEYMSKERIFIRIFLITLIASVAVFLFFWRQQNKYLITPLIRLGTDIQRINFEHNRSFRLPTEEKEPLAVLRKSINQVLEKTEELFGQLQSEEEELNRVNEDLELNILQLTASKEELRVRYEQIIESEYTFRTLFEGSADAIFLFVDYKLIDCNSAMLELLEYASKESLLGRNPWELSPELQPDGKSSQEKALEIIRTTLENGKCRFEWWHQKSDATLVPVEVMLTIIILNGKKVFHALWRDVGERKKLEQQLEYMSYHDQLTGRYNRRFFEEELRRLDVERNYPMTIVMADVNGLKLINDSFGHALGDELIKKVSEVIGKGCRADDIIARLGGDEFVILLPKTDNYKTEQIIKRIEGEALKEKVGSIEISVSFGWETKNNVEEEIQDILKKAEDYMYKKKLFEGPSMREKTIKAIISTLYEKNKREEQHSYRVSLLCESMGKALSLSEGEIQELKSVGLLHDIGKIAIDENIHDKSGKLTDDEWKEMKRHPEIGYRILSTFNEMSEMSEYVLAHHERWDGKGYPKGLKNEEIPIQSRIINIADAYDAMTSERSYRSTMSEEVAIEELQKNAGSQFDPDLVKVFIKLASASG